MFHRLIPPYFNGLSHSFIEESDTLKGTLKINFSFTVFVPYKKNNFKFKKTKQKKRLDKISKERNTT